MASLDPTTFTPDQLADMLHAWADGLYTDEAAVGLLITHRTWLTRRDFLTSCVDAIDDGWTREGSAAMASIDWARAARLAYDAPCSTSESAVLRLAASLAGTSTGDLATLTRGLDVTNIARLLEALAHRAGWHESHHAYTVTGHQHPATAAPTAPPVAVPAPAGAPAEQEPSR
jgi:hypothetical protein